MKKIEDLYGKKVKFYGVWNECFKLGSTVFEAVEDEDDGYRSYLETIATRDKTSDMVFATRYIAEVFVVQDCNGYHDGLRLIDADGGHTWLRVGTDDYDCYYPCFVFDYTPKQS